MKRFVTSDLHVGHGNIIKYCPDSRGHLDSVAAMEDAIINNINSMVTDDDELYILGDIAFSSPQKACDVIKQLNGKKFIIWGNHDTKLRNSTEFEAQKGLMGVVWSGDYLELKHTTDEGVRHNIIMMHFPIHSWNGMHHGSIHLHGHCHSPFEKRNTFGDFKRAIDVGLDGNSMMPHSVDDLCSEMSRRDFRFEGHHDGSR